MPCTLLQAYFAYYGYTAVYASASNSIGHALRDQSGRLGKIAVIVTNADGRGVHYRILSPKGEQDDVLLRSPKQLWLVKAGHWLLGITRGENPYPENENITPSRVHFIPVDL